MPKKKSSYFKIIVSEGRGNELHNILLEYNIKTNTFLVSIMPDVELNQKNKIAEELKDFNMFGQLHRTLIGRGYLVYHLLPFSKDCLLKYKSEQVPYSKYRTQKQASDAAVNFFKQNGFKAIPFDLEAIVDKIK